MKVCAFAVVFGSARTAYPVHGVTAWAGLGDHPLSRMATAQAHHFCFFQFGIWQVGNVDIQQPGVTWLFNGRHQLLH